MSLQNAVNLSQEIDDGEMCGVRVVCCTWGTELDLARFMRKEVPRPKARPSSMLAANRYRNLTSTVTTRPPCRLFSSFVPSSCIGAPSDERKHVCC